MSELNLPTLLSGPEQVALNEHESHKATVALARTKEALGAYASQYGMNQADFDTELSRLGQLSPKRLKKLRKKLLIALKINAEYGVGFSGNAQTLSEAEDSGGTDGSINDEAALTEEQSASDTKTKVVRTVSKAGRDWIQELLETDVVDDFTTDEAVKILASRFNVQDSWTSQRGRINAKKRIRMRLNGNSLKEIATAENVTVANISAWFKEAFKTVDVEDPTVDVSDQNETSLTVEPVVKSNPLELKNNGEQTERYTDDKDRHVGISNRFSQIFILNDADTQRLIMMLDVDTKKKITNEGRELAQRLKAQVSEILGSPEVWKEKLEKNEFVRLQKFFGFKINRDGEATDSNSVQLSEQVRNVTDQTQRNILVESLYSGLNKILDLLESKPKKIRQVEMVDGKARIR